MNADNRHVLSLPTLGRKLTLPVTLLFELHNFFARPPRNDRTQSATDPQSIYFPP